MRDVPIAKQALMLILQEDLILRQALLIRAQRLEHLILEIRHIIRRPCDLRKPHEPLGINCKAPAHLPSRAALGGRVPDALVLAEAVGRVQRPGVEGVPGGADAQPPGAVEVAVRVGDDLDLPLAADLDDPLVRVGLGGVRDGNAVDFGVAGGEFRQEAERLFGDCVSARLAALVLRRVWEGIAHMDIRSVGERR